MDVSESTPSGSSLSRVSNIQHSLRAELYLTAYYIPQTGDHIAGPFVPIQLQAFP
jgi:hypothetical protein